MDRRQAVRRQQAGHRRDRSPPTGSASTCARSARRSSCFCSKGDNITPPQQALGWILDLYDSVDDIRAYGQTIVYCVHENVGHLGIFVSGGVAKKEHDEFASNIDLIDVLPPGLYEAVLITPREAGDADADRSSGDCVIRFAGRARSTTFARSAATTPRTSDGSPPRRGSPRSTSASTAPSCSPACAPWSARPLAEWMRQTAPAAAPATSCSPTAIRWLRPVADARRADPRGPRSRRRPTIRSRKLAGRRFAPDRGRARRLPRPARPLARADLPRRLRLAAAAGPGRPARQGRAAAAAPGRGSGPPRLRRAADGGAAGADRRGRPARGRDACAALHLHAAAHRRRADLQPSAADARRARRRDHARRVQGALREQGFMLLLDQERAVATLPQLLASALAEQIREALAVLRRVAAAGGPLGANPRPASRRSPASSGRPPRPRRRDGPRPRG